MKMKRTIVEHNPKWVELYNREAELLPSEFESSFIRIDHIGGTSVPGMASRPIIDILLEVSFIDRNIVSILERLGYAQVELPETPEDCLVFELNTGYETIWGYRLYVVSSDSPMMRSILFRDHLREYEVVARRYEELKHRLAGDDKTYAEGKADFIRQITERAELGRRFPITVVEYDPNWPRCYEEEAAELRSLFGPELVTRIEHFGSTAVPGLAAKPVIDILIEISSFEDAKREIIPKLEELGYIYSWQQKPERGHMALWKGYIPNVPSKFHIHMVPGGHPLMDDLLFRDYLIENPDTAKQYEKLKYRLASIYPHDREEYTDAKSDFISEVTNKAKEAQP